MTEVQWLSTTDALVLLRALPTPSVRKSELFACGCCRHLWHKMTDPRTRRALELAELFIDGAASREELLGACGPARAVENGYILIDKARGYRVTDHAASIAAGCCLSIADHDPSVVARANYFLSSSDDIPGEWKHQSDLVRCIFGNPYRLGICSAEWRTDTVLALARQMYDSREFGAMPILADALQDAGCENAVILGHCRDTNCVHVRGCWVVDSVLGKE
jgi:hypothetical protein